ncbi:hypothetical protein [Aliihoeflea sp. 2WW]|uniref:hypothetical protein n=1 Tax=Aliihoeflea sp. 2WW TaxID=1381123 RepID=UPI0004667FCF|nr:hypothetical protein [Aliihoeflea sp. 2WW]
MYVDGDGIPYSDYANYRGIELGLQRSILAVAERGLWYWNEFLRGRFQRPLLLSYDWKRWPENRGGNPKNADDAQAMLIKCADWVQ